MKRTLITPQMAEIPVGYHSLFEGNRVYDSSCSPFAKVYYIEKDGGYFLKRSEKRSLEKEALMTSYFAKKGLSANVCSYISDGEDWLLTERVRGEDCTFSSYLEQPKRLCDTLAETLKELHSLDHSDCPVQNKTADYLAVAEKNYRAGMFDPSYCLDDMRVEGADEAWKIITEKKHLLKADTLLHGDYCLPNILLDDWSLSGFIDLGGAGVGEKHIDLFWAAWTLNFNLKTDKYRNRFFDCYGRDEIDEELISLIGVIEAFG